MKSFLRLLLKIDKSPNSFLNKFLTSVIVLVVFFLAFKQNYLGDASYFVNAGKKLLEGNNQYREKALHTGPLGAISMGLFFGYLGKFTIFIVTLLNLSGIVFFVKQLLSGVRREHVSFIVILTLISSPTREMLVTGQITGILMGLVSLGSRLLVSAKLSWIGICFFVIAVELKPHFAIPLIFLFLAREGRLSLDFFKKPLLIIFIGHLLVNLHLRAVTEISFIQNILFLTNTDITTFERSVWTLLDPLLHPYLSYFLKITILICFCFLTLLLYRKNEIELASLSFLLVPLSQNYIHLYDFVWMTPIAFLSLERKTVRNIVFPFTLINLLLLPHPYSKVLNFLIFLLIVLLMFCFYAIIELRLSRRVLLLTFAWSFLIPLAYDLANLPYQESEAIFHSVLVILFALPLLNAKGLLQGDSKINSKSP